MLTMLSGTQNRLPHTLSRFLLSFVSFCSALGFLSHVGDAAAQPSATAGVATQLAITALNPAIPRSTIGFSVTIRANDAAGNAASVIANTVISLRVLKGTGVLGERVRCTIPAGENTCTVTGVTYSKGETVVVLRAARMVGDALAPVNTLPFTVTQTTHPVFPVASANGSIFPAAMQMVPAGSAGVFTVTPNKGYEPRIGGTCVGQLVGDTYTTQPILATCSVVVSFSIRPSGFQIVPQSAALISASQLFFPVINNPASLNISSTNSENAQANVNENTVVSLSVQIGTGVLGGVTSCTILAGTSRCTISGVTYNVAESGVVLRATRTSGDTLLEGYSPASTVFEQRYQVTVSIGANGTVSPASGPSISPASFTTFTVTPNPGYTTAVVGGTCGGQLTGNTFKTEGVISHCTVEFRFVEGYKEVKQIALGSGHTCTLETGGTVRCWGASAYGRLGLGDATNRTTPQTLIGLSNITQLAAGDIHTCALETGGTVKCWGRNELGELGIGNTADQSTPQTVPSLNNVTQLAAGFAHNCALITGGTVKCWGRANGQLTPQTVPNLNNVSQLSAGQFHTCALLTGGVVKCWGGNEFGQLGIGSTSGQTTPQTPVGLGSVEQLVTGLQHSCALEISGTVKCWGLNVHGQLGVGYTSNFFNSPTTPQTVSGLSNVTQLAAGGYSTCAQDASGAVKCWGFNNSAQLGLGYTSDLSNTPNTPQTVSGVNNVTKLALGQGNACALELGGKVKCWGDNVFGQLALASRPYQTTPQTLPCPTCLGAFEVVGTRAAVSRLYHPTLQIHLLTADSNEVNVLTQNGWRNDGQFGAVLGANSSLFRAATVPLFRLYDPARRTHFYTTDDNEYAVLATRGYVQDGIIAHLASEPNALVLPFFRLHSTVLLRHLFTTDSNEVKVLTESGFWVNEGIIGYVLK